MDATGATATGAPAVEEVAGQGTTAHDEVAAAKTTLVKRSRVLTPARREQNREAQRAYRQRQRELKARMREEKEKLGEAALRGPRQLAPRPLQAPALDASEAAAATTTDATSESVAAAAGEITETNTQQPTATRAQAAAAAASASAPSVKAQASIRTGRGSITAVIRPASGHSQKQQKPILVSSRDPPTLARMADPYTNGLHQVFVNIFHATLRNAIALGFDVSRLAGCADDYMSPIYQPWATPQTDPRELFLRAGFNDDLPQNLRPTLAQYLVPHHPCIDLIPIPILRDRAIILSATMPQAFSLTELKVDVYHRDGLVVWGSERAREQGGRDDSFWEYDGWEAGNWQPWDRRCWEAAPWFLKKWSIAVDGAQGELGKQSRWWEQVREARRARGVIEMGDVPEVM